MSKTNSILVVAATAAAAAVVAFCYTLLRVEKQKYD